MARKTLWGAWSAGTVNIAEAMPCLHALMWYESVHAPTAPHNGPRMVHVISDSEVTVNAGNRTSRIRDLSPLWAAWDNLLFKGYTARFHHAPREIIGLNSLCDELSRFSRQLIQSVEWSDHAPEGFSGVYEINPS